LILRKDWAKVKEEIQNYNFLTAKWFIDFISNKKLNYYDHQAANLGAISNIEENSGLLIADSVGLGKTTSAFLGMFYHILFNGARKILILAPPKLVKEKWMKELSINFANSNPRVSELNESSFHLPLYKVEKAEKYNFDPQLYEKDHPLIVFGTPYYLSLHLSHKTHKMNTCESAHTVLNTNWDLIIIDEIHMFSPSSDSNNATNDGRRAKIRYSNLARTVRNISQKSNRKIFLSATPMGNSIIEFLGVLSFIDRYFYNLINLCYIKSQAYHRGEMNFVLDPKQIIFLNHFIKEVFELITTGREFLVNKSKLKDIDEIRMIVSASYFGIKQGKNFSPKDWRAYNNWRFLIENLIFDKQYQHEEILALAKCLQNLIDYYSGKISLNDFSVLKNLKREISVLLEYTDLLTRFNKIVLRTQTYEIPEVKSIPRIVELKPIVIHKTNNGNQEREFLRVKNNLEDRKKNLRNSRSIEDITLYRMNVIAQKRLSSELYSYWKSSIKHEKNHHTLAESVQKAIKENFRSVEEEQLNFGEFIPKLRLGTSVNENLQGSTLQHFKLDSKKYIFMRDKILNIYFESDLLPIVIFTEYEDTLKYVADRLDRDFSYFTEVLRFSGNEFKNFKTPKGIGFNDLIKKFKEEPNETPKLIVATDAGSTGFDLPFCKVVINYDIPWNPVKLIQRVGRLDRINRREILEKANSMTFGTEKELNADPTIIVYNLYNNIAGGNDERIIEVQLSKITNHWKTLGSVEIIIDDDERSTPDIDQIIRYENEPDKLLNNITEKSNIPLNFGIKNQVSNLVRNQPFSAPIQPDIDYNINGITNLSLGLIGDVLDDDLIYNGMPIINSWYCSLPDFDQVFEDFKHIYSNNVPLFNHICSIVSSLLGSPLGINYLSYFIPKKINGREWKSLDEYICNLTNRYSSKPEVKRLLTNLSNIYDLLTKISPKEGLISLVMKTEVWDNSIFLVKNLSHKKALYHFFSTTLNINCIIFTWKEFDPIHWRHSSIIVIGLPLLTYENLSKLNQSLPDSIHLLFFDLEVEIFKAWLKFVDFEYQFKNFEKIKLIETNGGSVKLMNKSSVNTVKLLAELLNKSQFIAKHQNKTNNFQVKTTSKNELIIFELRDGTILTLKPKSPVFRPFVDNVEKTSPAEDVEIGDSIAIVEQDPMRSIFEYILEEYYSNTEEINVLNWLHEALIEIIKKKQKLNNNYNEAYLTRDLNKSGHRITKESVMAWVNREIKFPNNMDTLAKAIYELGGDKRFYPGDYWKSILTQIRGVHVKISQYIKKMAVEEYQFGYNSKNQFLDSQISITIEDLRSLVHVSTVVNKEYVKGDDLMLGVNI
jgi:ERCC4-related helicase